MLSSEAALLYSPLAAAQLLNAAADSSSLPGIPIWAPALSCSPAYTSTSASAWADLRLDLLHSALSLSHSSSKVSWAAAQSTKVFNVHFGAKSDSQRNLTAAVCSSAEKIGTKTTSTTALIRVKIYHNLVLPHLHGSCFKFNVSFQMR